MKFNVTIIEELRRTVQVEADHIADAVKKVKEDYIINGSPHLTYDDYAATNFAALEAEDND